MKLITIVMFIIILLLVGCTPNPIIIERNITVEKIVYNNSIICINNTICNTTCPEPEINTTIYDRDYVLGLIRQLKYYESRQDKYWNNTECKWELNQSNIEKDKAIYELCIYWNISWCN